ncbi:MAG: hypothetical protein ACRECY_18150 [Phyllobacterium sp.]
MDDYGNPDTKQRIVLTDEQGTCAGGAIPNAVVVGQWRHRNGHIPAKSAPVMKFMPGNPSRFSIRLDVNM